MISRFNLVPLFVVVFIVILAAPAAAQPDNLVLTVRGECPGPMTVEWSGAEPNRHMAILYGPEARSGIIPSVRCGGTELGVGPGHRIIIVARLRTGPDGRGRVTGMADPTLCGGYVQLIVYDAGNPCSTSNVVQIP